MREEVLTSKEVGKYIFIRITEANSLPVKIISVGGGCCGWMVVDPSIPLRSGKCRIDGTKICDIYDTEEEILKQTIQSPVYGSVLKRETVE
jgi:hypothetical protein